MPAFAPNLHSTCSALFLSCLLVACSSSDDNAINGVVNDASGNGTFDGQWRGQCEVDTDGGSDDLTYVLNGNGFSSIFGSYSDTFCQSKVLDLAVSGRFLIGNNVSLADGTTASEVDVTISSASIVVATPNGAANANSNALCGITNWAAGVSFDVTNCAQLNLPPPSTGYDLFLVEGNTIFFGDDSGDGTSPQTRPSGIDRSEGVFRQP